MTGLVEGVAQAVGALGYFGLAYFEYFEENPGMRKALPIGSGSSSIAPSAKTVMQAAYQPLAQPLFIYVNYTSTPRNLAMRKFVE